MPRIFLTAALAVPGWLIFWSSNPNTVDSPFRFLAGLSLLLIALGEAKSRGGWSGRIDRVIGRLWRAAVWVLTIVIAEKQAEVAFMTFLCTLMVVHDVEKVTGRRLFEKSEDDQRD